MVLAVVLETRGDCCLSLDVLRRGLIFCVQNELVDPLTVLRNSKVETDRLRAAVEEERAMQAEGGSRRCDFFSLGKGVVHPVEVTGFVCVCVCVFASC